MKPRFACAAVVTRSIAATRSTSHARSAPFSLILIAVTPLYGIHASSVSGRPSPTGLLTSAAVSASLAPTEWYMRTRGAGFARDILIQDTRRGNRDSNSATDRCARTLCRTPDSC